MISKNSVIFTKMDKKDYFININPYRKKGIFNPHYKGDSNSFFYDFNLEKCRKFHKYANTYTILDLSPDGSKIITISNKNIDKTHNNILKILEIGTNKVLFENRDFYTYEAYFTANPKYIICRVKYFNDNYIYVYDIESNKIVHNINDKIFIQNGCFDGKRSNFLFPSREKDDYSINRLNFETLSTSKIDVSSIHIFVNSVKLINNKELLLIEPANKSLYLYYKRKVIWKLELSELFISEYDGGFFHLDKKIYFDTPAVNQNSKNMVLFRIDEDNGSLEHINLPFGVEYRKFTPMFENKIIDMAGNIIDIRNEKTSLFNINSFK